MTSRSFLLHLSHLSTVGVIWELACLLVSVKRPWVVVFSSYVSLTFSSVRITLLCLSVWEFSQQPLDFVAEWTVLSLFLPRQLGVWVSATVSKEQGRDERLRACASFLNESSILFCTCLPKGTTSVLRVTVHFREELGYERTFFTCTYGSLIEVVLLGKSLVECLRKRYVYWLWHVRLRADIQCAFQQPVRGRADRVNAYETVRIDSWRGFGAIATISVCVNIMTAHSGFSHIDHNFASSTSDIFFSRSVRLRVLVCRLACRIKVFLEMRQGLLSFGQIRDQILVIHRLEECPNPFVIEGAQSWRFKTFRAVSWSGYETRVCTSSTQGGSTF